MGDDYTPQHMNFIGEGRICDDVLKKTYRDLKSSEYYKEFKSPKSSKFDRSFASLTKEEISIIVLEEINKEKERIEIECREQVKELEAEHCEKMKKLATEYWEQVKKYENIISEQNERVKKYECIINEQKEKIECLEKEIETVKDNIILSDGPDGKAVHNGKPPLTEDQISRIRELRMKGMKHEDVAFELNIGVSSSKKYGKGLKPKKVRKKYKKKKVNTVEHKDYES